jgi:hypothetical protein
MNSNFPIIVSQLSNIPTPRQSNRLIKQGTGDSFTRKMTSVQFGQSATMDVMAQAQTELDELHRLMTSPSFKKMALNDFTVLQRFNAFRNNPAYADIAQELLSKNRQKAREIREAFHNDVFRREKDLYDTVLGSKKTPLNFLDWEQFLNFNEYFTPTAAGPFSDVASRLHQQPGQRPKAVSIGTGFTPSTGIYLASHGWDVVGIERDRAVHQASLALLNQFSAEVKEHFKIRNMNGSAYRAFGDANLVYITTMVPNADRLKIFDAVLATAKNNPNLYVITHNVFGLGELANDNTPESEMMRRFDIVREIPEGPNYKTYILKPKE